MFERVLKRERIQRDWVRKETVPAFMDVFIQTGGTMGLQLAYDQETRA